MMKRKALFFIALVMVLVLSFTLPCFAIYNINVPFDSGSFTLISMSYYLDQNGNKVNFGLSTGTWQNSPSTSMKFYVPGCTGLVPAYRYSAGTGNSWNAGEIMTISMKIIDQSASAQFEQDPTKYRIVIQSGGSQLNFTASSVTYSDQTSGGYNNITVNFAATQTLETSIPVNGAVFQFYMPFAVSASATDPYIVVDYGNLVLSSRDGLENTNTQKVVDAIQGAVVEDFGYTTPDDLTSVNNSFGDQLGVLESFSSRLDDTSLNLNEAINNYFTDYSGAFSFLWCWYTPSILTVFIVTMTAIYFVRKIVK